MEHWDKFFLEELPQMIGAKDIEEIMFNPKRHFYFMGLKFMTLDLDIQKRIQRFRPASLANVLAISKLLGRNIKIPNIPRTYYKSQGIAEKITTPEQENKFLETIQFRLKSRYRIDVSLDELRKIFNFENEKKIKPKNVIISTPKLIKIKVIRKKTT